MGPEDKVKRALKKALDAHKDRIDHFTVMTRGAGTSGVADRVGTFRIGIWNGSDGRPVFGVPISDDFIGAAFRIECKGKDAGKPTALQELSLSRNAELGGFSAVCRPSVQTIYFSDGSGVDMNLTPAELVEYMLSGEWVV